MWLRVERLIQGTTLTAMERETRFNNEFDQFIAEPGESLVLVYNQFSQLMHHLKRNKIELPTGTIDTKFLNYLQPEIKYVTNVHLAKNLTKDPYDDLFDYLKQYEKIVIASRAKKLEKTHDPLALVTHTSFSSRSPHSYYVTHYPSVIDYDDEYQGETFQNDPEGPLTSAIMLIARAITQRYSTPTNNQLCSSSSIRNQAVVQADRVNIQSKNVGNDGRITRRSYNVQDESAKSSNVLKETRNVQRNLRTTSSENVTNVQCYNCSEKGHYACNYLIGWIHTATEEDFGPELFTITTKEETEEIKKSPFAPGESTA
ncbi:retrovirus-related pol polyprotein from transposon TNT 1-94 [Tanacetum coccineum]